MIKISRVSHFYILLLAVKFKLYTDFQNSSIKSYRCHIPNIRYTISLQTVAAFLKIRNSLEAEVSSHLFK